MLLLSKEIQQADVACHDLETDALVLGSNCTVIYDAWHKLFQAYFLAAYQPGSLILQATTTEAEKTSPVSQVNLVCPFSLHKKAVLNCAVADNQPI